MTSNRAEETWEPLANGSSIRTSGGLIIVVSPLKGLATNEQAIEARDSILADHAAAWRVGELEAAGMRLADIVHGNLAECGWCSLAHAHTPDCPISGWVKAGGPTVFTAALDAAPREEFCHADRDGDCSWSGCPQLRDGEPVKTGRHCPLDVAKEESTP